MVVAIKAVTKDCGLGPDRFLVMYQPAPRETKKKIRIIRRPGKNKSGLTPNWLVATNRPRMRKAKTPTMTSIKF